MTKFVIICLSPDTDSLMFHVETEDVYRDMKEMEEDFDFSNYDQNHPMYNNARKAVPGLFKVG